MTRGLFVFRRDLRLEDNLGLIALLEACDEVACMFVGTPEQLQKNKLRNPRATAFLTECLTDLAEDLKKRGASLYIAYGDPVDEVIRVAKSIDATHLAYNIDYTPYARNRDASLTSAAEKERITVIATQDYALSDVIGLRTAGGQGNPYTVFTPFWRAVEANTIPHPISNRTRTKQMDIGDGEGLRTLETLSGDDAKLVSGGRKEGLKKLRALKTLRGYSEGRHMLDMETSLMSAYHKFGCVSPRESQWRSVELWGSGNAWARQLIWRDFFQHRVQHWGARAGENDGDRSPQKIGNRGVWPGNARNFRAWVEGKTGVPVVDAGMRQLATVGYMHNRARMVVANFLTRNLMIDWRRGERWFAEQLTDYDFSVNFMNWLGIAGLFKGDQPWRMMNPWIQSRERDPNAEQIRRWVPELREVEIGDIHKWDDAEVREKYAGRVEYPAPIVDYVETRGRQLEWVKTRKEADIM